MRKTCQSKVVGKAYFTCWAIAYICWLNYWITSIKYSVNWFFLFHKVIFFHMYEELSFNFGWWKITQFIIDMASSVSFNDLSFPCFIFPFQYNLFALLTWKTAHVIEWKVFFHLLCLYSNQCCQHLLDEYPIIWNPRTNTPSWIRLISWFVILVILNITEHTIPCHKIFQQGVLNQTYHTFVKSILNERETTVFGKRNNWLNNC